eukprot:1378224-Amorphochlora_amoeboformis.AAC.2
MQHGRVGWFFSGCFGKRLVFPFEKSARVVERRVILARDISNIHNTVFIDTGVSWSSRRLAWKDSPEFARRRLKRARPQHTGTQRGVLAGVEARQGRERQREREREREREPAIQADIQEIEMTISTPTINSRCWLWEPVGWDVLHACT